MMSLIPSSTEWGLFWVVWILVFCCANSAAVVASLSTHSDSKSSSSVTSSSSGKTHITGIKHAPSSWAGTGAFAFQIPPIICGKRKARDDASGMTSALSQSKWKQQRRPIVVAQAASQPTSTKQTKLLKTNHSSQFKRARTVSFSDAMTPLRGLDGAGHFASLRRVVSCDSVTTSEPTSFQELRTSAHGYLFRLKLNKDQPLHTTTGADTNERSPVADLKSQLRSFLVEKLRMAARNTVDEVLTSVLSFLTYAMLLFLVRQYSAVAIGVSLDLGAFSIEL